MKALLRRALRAYIRGFPLQSGKSRLMERFAPVIGKEGEVTVALPCGARMTLDLGEHVQQWIYYFGAYEERLLAWVRAYLRPGMTFVDAGAHVGQYTVTAARAVGPKGRVHAFEPGRANFERLEKNIALNGFQNVKANRLALDETPGEVELFEPSSGNTGENSLYRFSPEMRCVRVPSVSLDDYLASKHDWGTDRVSLVKIDVQGAEERVVRGARETLIRDRPAIVCEFEERWLRGLGSSTEELLRRFEDFGYQPFVLRRKGLKPLRKRGTLEFETMILLHETATEPGRDRSP